MARSADRFQALWSYYEMDDELYPEQGRRERRRSRRKNPSNEEPDGQDNMKAELEVKSAEELLPGEDRPSESMPALYRGQVHMNKKMNVLMEELVGL